MPGAELYEVGPGKSYATIQAALDQLWTDQGGSNFAATQEIRVYDDTYTEAVALNAGLRPASDFRLKLNAASGNDSVVVTNSGLGTSTIDLNAVDNVRVTGITVRNVIAGGIYALRDGGMNTVVRDCTFDGQDTATYGVYPFAAVRFVACTFTGFTGSLVRYTYWSEFVRCTFEGASVLVSYGGGLFEACVFDGAHLKHYTTDVRLSPPGTLARVRNCTFYNYDYAFYYMGPSGYNGHRVFVRNCIFHTVGTVFEGANSNLHRIVSDRNCFYNCTHIAQIGGTDYDSLAAWQAFTDEEGESPDAGSIAADPKLADPAGGDFSLEDDSPCKHAGAGAGVLAGLSGTPFDPHHPDIGAASKGAASAPGRPSITNVAVTGDQLTVSLDGNPGVENTAELLRARTGEVVDSSSRDGDGDVTLTAPELSARYLVIASSKNAAGRSLPSAPWEVIVSVGPGPGEEMRIAVVSRLRAHAGLSALLGTDETGAVPVYAAGPARARRVPCLVYTFSSRPDEDITVPGRWLVTFAFEAWGGSPGVNDAIAGYVDEILDRQFFQTTSWAVKRSQRGEDGVRWADDGRTETRRLSWTLVVDDIGS